MDPLVRSRANPVPGGVARRRELVGRAVRLEKPRFPSNTREGHAQGAAAILRA